MHRALKALRAFSALEALRALGGGRVGFFVVVLFPLMLRNRIWNCQQPTPSWLIHDAGFFPPSVLPVDRSRSICWCNRARAGVASEESAFMVASFSLRSNDHVYEYGS